MKALLSILTVVALGVGVWLCIGAYGWDRGLKIALGSALIASVIALIGGLARSSKSSIPMVLLALFAFPAVAQHDQYHLEDIEQLRDAEHKPEPRAQPTPNKGWTLHPEVFSEYGVELAGGDRFTAAWDMQLGAGAERWRFARSGDPYKESDGPRFAFLGVGIGGSRRGMEMRFPLLTVRIVRNVWLGTAVTVPFAMRTPSNDGPGFSITLSVCALKQWWEN